MKRSKGLRRFTSRAITELLEKGTNRPVLELADHWSLLDYPERDLWTFLKAQHLTRQYGIATLLNLTVVLHGSGRFALTKQLGCSLR